MSFVASVGVVSAVYMVFGRLERARALRFRELSRPRRHLATDLAWYGVAIIATAISVFVFRPVVSRLSVEPLRDALAGVPFLAKLLLGVVVFDLVSFLVHRGMHRSDRLWRIHKVHHSSQELDALATTRTHMAENMLRFVPSQAVLFVIGMPVGVVAATTAVGAIYGVSNHSNFRVDLRCVESIFVTPRLHRRHHVPSTTMNNYGGILTIWDRLAGTLVRADTSPDDRYGVPGEIDTYPQRFADAFRRPFRSEAEGNDSSRGGRIAVTGRPSANERAVAAALVAALPAFEEGGGGEHEIAGRRVDVGGGRRRQLPLGGRRGSPHAVGARGRVATGAARAPRRVPALAEAQLDRGLP